LDALSRCGRLADLKSKQEGLIHLPSNPGFRGSLGATMKIMDEASARCNQQAYDARHDLPNRVTTRKSLQTFTFTSPKYHSYRTHFIWNNISLDIAKYYFTIPFYPLPHSVYGGVLEYKQICYGMFTYLHKHKAHYSRVLIL